MKKLAVFSAVMVLTASIATAASLAVPFFRDNGGNFVGSGPASGGAGFIGINNNQGVAMDVQVTYTTFVGGVAVVETTSTFQLGPNAQVSWRPYADDPDVEGGGAAIDNIVTGAQTGSAKISYVRSLTPAATTTFDIQGRYVEITADGGSFSYLLPPGF